jgi:hypothetical protein
MRSKSPPTIRHVIPNHYVYHAFFGAHLAPVLSGVLLQVGIEGCSGLEDILKRYVMHHHWPGWVAQALKGSVAKKWSGETRLAKALAWARTLQLVKDACEGKQIMLHLTPKGHQWVSRGLEEQYAGIYDVLRTSAGRKDVHSDHRRVFYSGLGAFTNLEPGDRAFLGEEVTVLTVEKANRPRLYWDAKPGDQEALRQSPDRALAVLKPGAF